MVLFDAVNCCRFALFMNNFFVQMKIRMLVLAAGPLARQTGSTQQLPDSEMTTGQQCKTFYRMLRPWKKMNPQPAP